MSTSPRQRQRCYNFIFVHARPAVKLCLLLLLLQVWVFHVGTAKVVAKIAGHKINVRGMDRDQERNLLLTCSFDKTFKVWSGA